jgi:mannose-6-phosphate isomerase-like protein (cupin superfamily)
MIMGVEVVRFAEDRLKPEYGLIAQRLKPWAPLNSPFESAWARVKPHSESVLHSHHEHEIFVAVGGEAVIECEGERTPFARGDVAFFKPGLRHHILNESDADFEFYSIWWDEEMAQQYITRNRLEAEAAAGSMPAQESKESREAHA